MTTNQHMFNEELLKQVRDACKNNNHERVEALVKKLRKHPRYWSKTEWSSTTDSQRRSLLHYCCFSSKPDVLRTFIIWGAGDHDVVNDVNMLGQSPLHVAAASNDIESARLLLDAGASVHTLDSAMCILFSNSIQKYCPNIFVKRQKRLHNSKTLYKIIGRDYRSIAVPRVTLLFSHPTYISNFLVHHFNRISMGGFGVERITFLTIGL